ncbi:MAG: thiosulfate reductase [Chitinophaga sp.]|jgi:thiosulfate reductase cytochrome b subunit|nr:thiosulfate reductase [Chitinophaga sp.]
MPAKIIHKHKLATRWMHWINFPALTIMIWSGMLIYWANDVYEIKIGGYTIIKFFPDWFYKFFHIPYKLAEGMGFHFAFMWLFMINGLFYIIYTFASGEWKYLLPDKKSFKESWLVVLHDLGIRKQAPEQLKYNAAQRIAYSAIIIMGIGSVITGFAIYKPVQVSWLTAICGGYEAARAEHFILTVGYVLFFLIHVIQVIKAGWNNFRAMIAGFEIIKEKENHN